MRMSYKLLYQNKIFYPCSPASDLCNAQKCRFSRSKQIAQFLYRFLKPFGTALTVKLNVYHLFI